MSKNSGMSEIAIREKMNGKEWDGTRLNSNGIGFKNTIDDRGKWDSSIPFQQDCHLRQNYLDGMRRNWMINEIKDLYLMVLERDLFYDHSLSITTAPFW
jgi:hypothetical protein